MSGPADANAELRELIQRLLDGALTLADSTRLNELLHGNPEACEIYLDQVTLEAHLHAELGGQQPGVEALPAFVRHVPPPKAPTGQSASWLQPLSRFAAAVLLGAGLTLLSVRFAHDPAQQPAEPIEPPVNCVATLLFADDCEWRKQEPLVEGQRLCPGSLRLENGLALLRFDGGAAVVLQGPTELDLESAGAARLRSGRLTVRAPAVAAGFTVRTPASDVVDLGTEFAVVVERGGATELHVLEGEVIYGKPGGLEENSELLVAGEAVRYDQAQGRTPRAVPLKATRFAELLSQARIGPRDDLLLVYEGFDYPLGRQPLAKTNGGQGWDGPWRMTPRAQPVPGELEDLNIGAGELKVPWPVPGGRGPALQALDDFRSRIRTLAQPVALDEDGVYYVSLLVRWQPPPENVPTNPLPAVRFVLRSSRDMNGDHVMFNLPVSQRPQLDLRSGAVFTSAQTVPRDETQFWVGKIIARKHGDDEVFFRVYGQKETLDAIEPADWTVRARGVRSDARLDVVLLTKFGTGRCWWDEIRIGKSWRAVVPQPERKP